MNREHIIAFIERIIDAITWRRSLAALFVAGVLGAAWYMATNTRPYPPFLWERTASGVQRG